jgi:hypothetical protein
MTRLNRLGDGACFTSFAEIFDFLQSHGLSSQFFVFGNLIAR